MHTYVFTIVISGPDDVTVCEGGGATFTCVLDNSSNISSSDVQWYRVMIMDTYTLDIRGQKDSNISFITSTINDTLSSLLTITNARESYAGYYWVGTSKFSVCNASLTVLTRTYVKINHAYTQLLKLKYIMSYV